MKKILLYLAVLTVFASCVQPQGKPNVIFFLIDDMGWKDVGFMGSDFYETPNIDRLASEGMIFNQAYSNAPNCAPSRACILTGQYAPRHGIYTVGSSERGDSTERKIIPVQNNMILSPGKVTFPELLQSAGYSTFFGGKWHVGRDPESGPLAQGFDVNVGGGNAGSPPGGYFAPWRAPGLEEAPDSAHLCDYVTDKALEFLHQHQRDPFFIYLSYYDVHTPLQAKAEIVQKYEEKKSLIGLDNHQTLHDHPVYAAMVENLDLNIGRVLKEVGDLGLEENTMVIFTSDNGGYGGATSMRPLRGIKGTLYEGGIRVPFVVKWPGNIEPGSSSDIPVIGLDIYPTILDLTEIEVPHDLVLDGESLLSVLTGGGRLTRESLFWHFPAYLRGVPPKFVNDMYHPGWRTTPGSVIRQNNWKLIEYFEDQTIELYDLNTDLSERQDLSKQNPNKASELYELLKSWQRATGAPVPRAPNPHFIAR